MKNRSHERVAVFVSSGLGNAIQLIPLIKKLKEQGKSVTGIFVSKNLCEQIFDNSPLFDDSIVIKKSIAALVGYLISSYKKFQTIYLDHFACTKKNIIASRFLANEVVVQHIPDNLLSLFNNRLELIKPIADLQGGIQNLRLLDSHYSSIKIDEFYLENQKDSIVFDALSSRHKFLKNKYICINASAGNNPNHYKNWPLKHWVAFLKLASKKYPNYGFIVLGDPNEVEVGNQVMKESINNVFSLAGKTSIKELKQILIHSDVLVGLDSGLMHLAVALQKPTFTIWGPSNHKMFSYESVDEKHHKVVYDESVDCRPCNAWIGRNTSRVSDPWHCPDRKCMSNMQPSWILDQFSIFFREKN